MRRVWLFYIFTLSGLNSYAQINADFTVTDSVCLNQIVSLTNNSENYDSLVWDFSNQNLDSITEVGLSTTIPSANVPTSVKFIYDSLNWYGFVSSRGNHKILRLDYGSSLDNTPNITDLGNVSGLLSGPKNIEFFKEGGIWYALLINFTNNTLLRLSFTNGLSAAPTATSLGNLSGWSKLRGLDLVLAEDSLVAIVSSFNNNKLTLLNFGNSIKNNPSGSDIMDIAAGHSLLSGPIGIRLIQEAEDWFGFVASNKNHKLLKLEFGNNLFSQPAISEVQTVTSPTEIQIENEDFKYHVFLSSVLGNIFQFQWNDAFSENHNKYRDWGNFGDLSKAYGFDIVYSAPNFKAFSLNFSTKKIHQISFDEECCTELVSLKSSNEDNPEDLSYFVNDTFQIKLAAYDQYGNLDVHQDTVFVKNASSPSVSFTTNNNCIDNQNLFSATSSDEPVISSWNWDFGDGNTNSGQNVSYQFADIRKYLVSLNITTVQGCNNSTADSISISAAPVASFDLPLSNLCTNSEISFSNTSNSLYEDSAIFIWSYNNTTIDTTTNGSFAFSSDGLKNISLVIDLTGCRDTIIQQVNLSPGPNVDFAWTNNCFGDSLQMINISETVNTRVDWNFGDGSPSSNLFEPKYLYSSAGSYLPSLTVTDTVIGCTSLKTHSIFVNNQPLANFSYLKPIIENIPAPFYGNDLTQQGDSIVQWNWNFQSFGTAADKSPTPVFNQSDSLRIELSVLTEQGCTNLFIDSIFVEQANKPSPFFLAQDSLCLNEELQLANATINGDKYIWDFCFDALEHETGISEVLEITDGLSPEGIEIVYDKGSWYGFVTSRNNSKIFRLDFGSSLDDTPVIVDLGNLGGLVSGPKNIQFIKENGDWYGILANATAANLVRLEFGTDLSNIPTGMSLGNLSAWNTLRGIDLVQSNDSIVVIVSSHKTHNLSLINFGNSITNTPTADDILDIGVGNSLISKPMGISLQQSDGRWSGLLSSQGNNKVLLLDFGSNLFSEPLITEIGSLTSPTDAKLVRSGNKFYGIVMTASSGMYRIPFGSSLTTYEPIENMASVTGTKNVYNIGIARVSPTWKIFTINYSNKKIKRIDFEDVCSTTSLNNSVAFQPQNISYDSAGTFLIELTAFSANGNYETDTDTIVVKNTSSPSISFSTDNTCIDNENTFSGSSSDEASISSWNWDFGNGNSDSGQNVNHQFADTGSYVVKLDIEALNGCSGSSQTEVSIYKAPLASFTFEESILCSNSEISFTNYSSFNGPDSLLTFQWNFNDEFIENQTNASHSFTSGGDKTVTLTSTIPGCSSDTSAVVSVIPGPMTNFSATGNCQYDEFSFVNSTTGIDITGYEWDFGDGYFSTKVTPSHRYENAENYIVKLSATSASGCTTEVVQVLPVRHAPEALFTNDLACSEDSLNLFDHSSVIDANISKMNWSVENTSIGYLQTASGHAPSVSLKNEGTYQITLISESNYGCIDTLVQEIDVLKSPEANLVIENICFGDSTVLSQNSIFAEGSELLSVDWLVEDNLYPANELKYKFQSPGDYKVELYVRASNYCTGYVRDTISILPLPDMNFELSSNCADQLITISSNVNLPAEQISSYGWSINNTPISAQPEFQYDFKKAEIYDIELDVSTSNGCYNSMKESFTIKNSPTSGFEVFPAIGASPLDVQMTDQSHGAVEILYYFSKYNQDFSTEPNPNYTYYEMGEDFITQVVTNEYGCSDTSVQLIEVVIPVYDLALTNSSAMIIDDQVNLTITVQNNGTIIVVNPILEIKIADKVSLTQKIETTLMPGDEKKYSLEFKIQKGINETLDYICFSVSNTFGKYEEANPNDNEECINIDQDFTVLEPFPNPSKTYVTIPIILPAIGSCDLQMIGENGSIVYSKTFKHLDAGINNIELDLTPYRQGVYLLSINLSGLDFNKKIVVQ